MCGAGMGTTKKGVWRREVAEKLGVLGGVACVEGFGDGMGMGMGMKGRFFPPISLRGICLLIIVIGQVHRNSRGK